MKNKIKILLILAVGAMVLPMCQKDPDLRIPDLQLGVVPQILKNTDLDQTIDIFNPEVFEGGVDVDLLFDDMPQKMDIMVAYNDSNRALLRGNVTSFPVSVDFSMNDLLDLIPELDSVEQLNPGDFFRVYAVTTLKDGTVIDGLDSLYAAYNSSISNQPGSNVDVKYTVVCPFDPDFAIGSYRCVSSPADWNVDGDVTITQDATDPTKFYIAGMAELDGATEDLGPLVMHIDPVTYAVTVDKTILASDFYGMHNFSYAGKGTYNSCDGSYEMSLAPTVTEGGWGTFPYTFTRND